MIDVHVHLFPDADAGRTWQEQARFEPVREGTLEDLAPRMAAAGIERAVLLLFDRSARRAEALRAAAEARGEVPDEAAIRTAVADALRAYDRWGWELAAHDPRFIAFTGVDPGWLSADELVALIDEGLAAGARGVKIVLPAQRRYPDDEALRPVLETCAARGLPLLAQSGLGGVGEPGPRGPFGRPGLWEPVLAALPGLRLILAHLGHGFEDEVAEVLARHDSVVTDTSLRLGSPRDEALWDPAPVRAFIERVGAERVLFGTNYPIADPVVYAERIGTLGLRGRDHELVTRGNAERVLGLTGAAG